MNKIVNSIKKNYNKASKNYYSDTWSFTGKENISFIKNDRINNILINPNLRGLAPIDNYPSYDFLKENDFKILNKLQKEEKFKLYKKNRVNNYFFSSVYTIHFRHFLNFIDKINSNSKVLIIGDGIGILASMIYRTYKCKIFLCDLPETLIYQEYFLRNNFNKAKTHYIGNAKDKIKENYDFNFINANELHNKNMALDLVINTDSFSEMDKVSIDKYFEFAENNLKGGGFFYYCNNIGLSTKSYRFPSEYPLSNKFKILKLDVYYPSYRDTFCKYLSILAQKKKNYFFNSNKNYLNKKSVILNKFYLDSEKIISKQKINSLSKKIIKLLNQISNRKVLKKKELNKINSHYLNNKMIYKSFEKSNFYHTSFNTISEFLMKKNRNELDNMVHHISKFNNQQIEVTSIVKILSLLRFFDKKYFEKIIKLIPENSFEKVFLKLCLCENMDNKILKVLHKKLSKFKLTNFFDEIKYYYISFKLKKYSKSKIILNNIEKNLKSEVDVIILLKTILISGDFDIFKEKYLLYCKKFKLTDEDKIGIFMSTNFVNMKTKEKFRKFIKRKNILKKYSPKYLGHLILHFKGGLISEKSFMKIIKQKFDDYYSIGYVLKNTINILSKKNVILFCNRSLKLNNKLQNISFIGEIYFFNFMFKNCFNTLKKINNIENFSMFSDLKKKISKYVIKDPAKKEIVCNLIASDLFRPIHNGRVVILPFLCSGNNVVRVNNN